MVKPTDIVTQLIVYNAEVFSSSPITQERTFDTCTSPSKLMTGTCTTLPMLANALSRRLGEIIELAAFVWSMKKLSAPYSQGLVIFRSNCGFSTRQFCNLVAISDIIVKF